MNKEETTELQIQLAETGFYLGNIDGIYGPKTAVAYEQFWASVPPEQKVAVVTPSPAKPWWTSEGIWGSLIVLAALPLKVVFGITYDPAAATQVIMPVVHLLPDAMIGIGGLMAFFGRKNAKAPIDPTLIARSSGEPIRIGQPHFPLEKPQSTNQFLDGDR